MPVETAIKLDDKEWSALQCLSYYSMFNHPLCAEEVFYFSKFNQLNPLKYFLAYLQHNGTLHQANGYYVMGQPAACFIENRDSGTKTYKAKLPKALKMAKRIWSFPFTRAIYFSGSASKENMKPKDDIDFFIITLPNRLWLCRAMLTLYKKVFLLNSKKYFCINYFISTALPAIEEKNYFTAMEMATLQPVIADDETHQAFMAANRWVHLFYPNAPVKSFLLPRPTYAACKRWAEKVFAGNMGDRLDTFFQTCFVNLLRIKYKKRLQGEFELAFKHSRHVSKHHPQNQQKKILHKLNQKMSEVCTLFHLQKQSL